MEGNGLNEMSDPTKGHHAESMKYQAYQTISYDYMSRKEDLTRRDVLRQVVVKRAADLKGCMFLPIALVYFALYAYSLKLHEDIDMVYYLESSIRNTLESTLSETQTIDDVWNWLQGDFINTMFVQEDIFGQTLPQTEWSRVLTYSQVQGAVILTQSRGDSAQDDTSWGQPLPGPLSPGVLFMQASNQGFTSEAEMPAERRLDMLREEFRSVLPGKAPEDLTYEFKLSPGMPLSTVKARLQYLRDRGWLDRHTNELKIDLLLLNAELGHPCLTRMEMRISFSRGGGVFYRPMFLSVFLESHPSTDSLLVDFLWLMMLIASTAWLLLGIWKSIVRKRLLAHITSTATLVEVWIMIMGWMVVGAFAMIQVVYLKAIRNDLTALRSAVTDSAVSSAAQVLPDASNALHASVEAAFVPLGNYQMVSSWYTLFLMFRFFLAFKAQPRLALVTNTLQSSSIDLLHFFAFFTPTFVAYVISGSLLFGRRLEDFSTIRASIGTCFRILIENEFEWDLLSEEHFMTTAIWTWSYLLIVVYLMLNMVLAIVLDVYNDVRQRVDSADTIFLFLRNMGKRVWNGRQWVTENELERVIDGIKGSTTLTKNDLREMIPKLTSSQADMLFSSCKDTVVFNLKSEMHRAAFLKMSSSIKQSIDKVNDDIIATHAAGPEETEAKAEKEKQREKKKAKKLERAASVETKQPSKPKVPVRLARSLPPGKKECVRPSKLDGRSRSNQHPSRNAFKRSGSAQSIDSLKSRASSASKASGSKATSHSGDKFSHAHTMSYEDNAEKGAAQYGRMTGTARPFPGMQKVPGGSNPPLLAPEQVPHVSSELRAERPKWLASVDASMDLQDQCMTSIQAELQQLQWRLHNATQQLAMGQRLANAKVSPEMSRTASKTRVVNGVPIL